jgi:hypothetical protein
MRWFPLFGSAAMLRRMHLDILATGSFSSI